MHKIKCIFPEVKHSNIPAVEVELPLVPAEGNYIKFKSGAIKDANGEVVGTNLYQVIMVILPASTGGVVSDDIVTLSLR